MMALQTDVIYVIKQEVKHPKNCFPFPILFCLKACNALICFSGTETHQSVLHVGAQELGGLS